MVVIFVLFFVLFLEDDLFLGVVDGRLEHFVGPLVLPAPTVVLILVLEVVVADVWVSVGNADVDAFVFEDPRDFSQHLF